LLAFACGLMAIGCSLYGFTDAATWLGMSALCWLVAAMLGSSEGK